MFLAIFSGRPASTRDLGRKQTLPTAAYLDSHRCLGYTESWPLNPNGVGRLNHSNEENKCCGYLELHRQIPKILSALS
jgi:hypothetical protein